MKLIFIPIGLSDDLMNSSIDQIKSDELESIKVELAQIDSNFEIKEENFGIGADWVMLVAILNSITTVFLLGDKINKGIEGWIKLGERIKRISSHSERIYIDLDTARILGINYLSKELPIDSVRILLEVALPLQDLSLSLTDRKREDFISSPNSLHLITYEVNDNYIIVLGIRSDGKINQHYRFDRRNHLHF